MVDGDEGGFGRREWRKYLDWHWVVLRNLFLWKTFRLCFDGRMKGARERSVSWSWRRRRLVNGVVGLDGRIF